MPPQRSISRCKPFLESKGWPTAATRLKASKRMAPPWPWMRLSYRTSRNQASMTTCTQTKFTALTVSPAFLLIRKGMIRLFGVAILLALFSTAAFADTDVPQSGANPFVFDQTATTDNIVVLTTGAAEHNSGMAAGNYGSIKYMWVSKFNHNTNDYFKWNVSLATGADYHVWALLNSKAAVPLRLSVEGETAALDFTTRKIGWDKLDAGVINIPAGTHILQLPAKSDVSGNIDIKSLELLRESDKPAYETRVTDFKRYPSWFSHAKYGLMLQYGPWGYPKTGDRKSLEDFANGFDVNKFVTMVQATGASYVIWSITWYSYQIIAPVEAVDRLAGPGHTSSRDVLGEI